MTAALSLPLSPEETELLEHFRLLSPDDQRMVSYLAETLAWPKKKTPSVPAPGASTNTNIL